MKRLEIIALLVSSLFFCCAGFATSAAIDLGGGQVAPTKVLKVSLDPLVPKQPYNITCHIVDKNNPQNPVIMVAQTEYTIPFGVGDFYLNGQDVGRGDWIAQFQLPKTTNTFEAKQQYHLCQSLNFTNADQDDMVEVDCSAVPMSG